MRKRLLRHVNFVYLLWVITTVQLQGELLLKLMPLQLPLVALAKLSSTQTTFGNGQNWQEMKISSFLRLLLQEKTVATVAN